MPLDPPMPRRAFLYRSLALGAALTGSGVPAGAALARRAPRSLRDKVARLFVVSFRGTALRPDLASLLERYPLGGVVLYARNCQTGPQIRSLLTEIQRASRHPMLVCTDQEGGSVVRIRRGAPVFPSEQTYGEVDSTQRIYQDARATAIDLRGLGLTMNLAPVVDVLANSRSPIGSRSFGPDPNEAARLSVAAINGYQQHGLAATAKHFVGLGHTSIDSHQALPTVKQTWEQLEQDDIIPFRAAIIAGVSTILVAHVALPKIDRVYRPASLSPIIIQDIIRKRLGFRGLIMTDSLLMGAVPGGQEPEAAERALAAGADILLLGSARDVPPGVIEAAIDQVSSAVATGRIPESRLHAALHHIQVLMHRYSAPTNYR